MEILHRDVLVLKFGVLFGDNYARTLSIENIGYCNAGGLAAITSAFTLAHRRLPSDENESLFAAAHWLAYVLFVVVFGSCIVSCPSTHQLHSSHIPLVAFTGHVFSTCYCDLHYVYSLLVTGAMKLQHGS